MNPLAVFLPAFFRVLVMALAAGLFTPIVSAQGVVLTPAQRALVAQAGNPALSPNQRVAIVEQIKAVIVANPAAAQALCAAANALPPAARARAMATVGTGVGGALATIVIEGRTADAGVLSTTLRANPGAQAEGYRTAGTALAAAAAGYLGAGNTAAATNLTTAVATLAAPVRTEFGAQLGAQYATLVTTNPTIATALNTLMQTTTDTTITTAFVASGGAPISLESRSNSPTGS